MDDLSEIELSPDDPQSVDSDRNSLSNSGVARIRNFHVEIERLKVNDLDRKIMRNYIKKRRLKENRKSQPRRIYRGDVNLFLFRHCPSKIF